MTLELPAEKKYRVIQWSVGNVGTVALRHWTAMGPANTVPAVCEAAPGFLTHKELGLVPLRGVVR